MNKKLRLVANNENPRRRERPIVATIEHKSQEMQDRGRQMIRHYTTLDKSLDGADRWIRHYGRVGTVVVIHHNLTGLELGTIRMNAKGHLTKKWNWET